MTARTGHGSAPRRTSRVARAYPGAVSRPIGATPPTSARARGRATCAASCMAPTASARGGRLMCPHSCGSRRARTGTARTPRPGACVCMALHPRSRLPRRHVRAACVLSTARVCYRRTVHARGGVWRSQQVGGPAGHLRRRRDGWRARTPHLILTRGTSPSPRLTPP
eukprot:4714541-Prymnesium_polylepis.1